MRDDMVMLADLCAQLRHVGLETGTLRNLIEEHRGRATGPDRLRRIGDRLIAEALTDSLTSLPNDRALAIDLEYLVEKLNGSELAVGLILGDVNDFKRHNEFRGELNYAAGDAVLKGIADILYSFITQRSIGWCYRGHGERGDEFMILLPGAAHREVLRVAAKLDELIRFASFTYREEVLPQVSMAMGSVSTSEITHSVPALVAAATSRLSAAKRAKYSARPPASPGELGPRI